MPHRQAALLPASASLAAIQTLAQRELLGGVDLTRLQQIARALSATTHTIETGLALPLLFGAETPVANAETSLRKLVMRLKETQDEAIASGAMSAGERLTLQVTRKTKGKASLISFTGQATTTARSRTDDLEGVGLLLENHVMPLALLGKPSEEERPIVLLVVNDNEAWAVRQMFTRTGEPLMHFERDGYPYSLLDYKGQRPIVMCRCEPGTAPLYAAQQRVDMAIRHLSPHVVVAVGIAFGTRHSQRLGDVLVSQRVQFYESARMNKDGSHTARGEPHLAPKHWVQAARTMDQPDFAVHPGLTLSGEKLVDDPVFRAQLMRDYPSAIGGDMEGQGLATACAAGKVDWVFIKGVSDWGDGSKGAGTEQDKTDIQRFAALNAATVAYSAIFMRRPAARPEWVELSHRAQRLAKDWPQPDTADHTAPPMCANGWVAEARTQDVIDVPHLFEIYGRVQTMAQRLKDAPKPESTDDRPATSSQTAQQALQAWLQDDAAPPVFALLGEYGMGKTISCQRLYRELRKLRQAGSPPPWAREPLYFDLRELSLFKNMDRHSVVALPSGAELLDDLLRHGWTVPPGQPRPQYGDIQSLIAQGALLILDGLDECLVHLTEQQHPQFVSTLVRLVTDHHRAAITLKPRLLLSCRSNFFKTLADQRNLFTGQHRGKVDAQWYQALELLPLTPDQIQQYLAAVLPGEDMARVQELIGHTHNLGELAQRPMTLKLLGEHIPELEAMRQRGEAVNGAALYGLVAHKWLQRDLGKHHLEPEHKLRLMPALAAHLWRSSARVMDYAALHIWFHAWRANQPDLAERYGPAAYNQTKLEEDLRTATFVVRQDGDESQAEGFRFAHSSLAEFFVARYLANAVLMDCPEDWAMPIVSAETLHFLAEILQTEQARLQLQGQAQQIAQTLNTWRKQYRAQASELLLAYALRSGYVQAPRPLLAGFCLTGAQLRGWQFGVKAAQKDAPLLPMQGVLWNGADLREVSFRHVRLDRADMTGACLDRAAFDHCSLDQSKWSGAHLVGTAFRHCRLKDSQLAAATHAYRVQIVDCEEDVELANLDRSSVTASSWLRAQRPQSNASRPGNLRHRLAWLPGHSSHISSVVFSPDGQRIASGAWDNTIRLWDAASGECLLTLRGHESSVASVAFSPDGQRIASGAWDNTVRLWDAASGEFLLTLQGHCGAVASVVFSPDSQRIASGAWDNMAHLWDAASGECLLTLRGHEGSVSSVAFSPDGKCIASGAGDKTVRLWDAASGECLLMLRGHTSEVTSVAFSPDGQRIVSGAGDKTVRLWDADSGECLLPLRGHTSEVTSVAFSPDGQRIASGADDATVRLWDANTGECLLILHGHTSEVASVAFSPDGQRIASGADETTVRLWDVTSGEYLLTLQGHQGMATSVAFSPDSQRIAAGAWDNDVRLWDAASGEFALTLQGHKNWVTSVAFSPDGQHIASGADDKTARLWDAANGECVLTLLGHEGNVSSVAFSPAGKCIASGADDKTVRLWDAVSGECLLMLRGHTSEVTSVAFSPDGQRIVSGARDSTLRLWDAVSGECLLMMQNYSGKVNSVAFSPDGKRIASGADDTTVRLWDAVSGKCLLMLRGHAGEVTSVAFSPDGQRIASGADDNTVRLWAVANGKCLLTLQGHDDMVASVAFSPDGQRIASAAWDNTVRLWDAASGQAMRCHWIARFGEASGHAVWAPPGADPANPAGHLLSASGDAWRLLGWQEWDHPSAPGQWTRLPLVY